jgi:hypothetical protein
MPRRPRLKKSTPLLLVTPVLLSGFLLQAAPANAQSPQLTGTHISSLAGGRTGWEAGAALPRAQAAAASNVTIGTATYPLTGTNVARGVDQLVAYTSPVTVTTTNMWGSEMTVVNGTVTAVNNRQSTGSSTGTSVPANGYVLSGHGAAMDWLIAHATVGATVQSSVAPPPVAPAVIGKVADIGAGTYAVSGTNVARGANQLVAYTKPVTVTSTNFWGTEVTVVGGKVTAVNLRESTGSTTGTTVPANGYVLSGNGAAKDWLNTYAKVGALVQYDKTTTPPPPPPPTGTGSTAPMALPAKVVALYYMMWSNSGSPKLSTIPTNVNVVNLSFLQGDPPSIVGWGAQGEASFIADAKALRARGVRIVASIGGAGGAVNVANRTAFVNSVMALNAKMPLDGIDWDLEGASMGTSDVVSVSQQLKAARGPGFSVTMAPNGSNVDQYRAVAVELQKVGALDMIGQQFYDAVVSKEAAKGRIDQLVAAGITQAHIGIGMMVGDADTYWTVPESMTAVNYIKAAYPGIRGGYLWEAGRPGTADWVTQVGALLSS